LIEFLGIDEDLVEVAASASAPLNAGPGRKELAEWIQNLPEEEKNDLLVTATLQSSERWIIEFLRVYTQLAGSQAGLSLASAVCGLRLSVLSPHGLSYSVAGSRRKETGLGVKDWGSGKPETRGPHARGVYAWTADMRLRVGRAWMVFPACCWAMRRS